MTKVLRKIGKSLRLGGNVLIIQPEEDNPIVEVEIDGHVAFKEATNEQNFRRYLRATKTAVQKTVGERIFEIKCEVIIPEGDSYHINEYETVNKWVEDRSSFCEDFEALNAMAEKMQNLVGSHPHQVSEYWREHKILLTKIG